MKRLAFIFFLFVSTNILAQTRKIKIHEASTCYSDTGLTNITMMYKNTGDSVIVTKFKNDFWAVPYEGGTVYVNEFNLTDITDEIAKTKLKKSISDNLIKRRLLIKKYGTKMGAFLSSGYIKLGLNKTQAKEAWGTPGEIHRTVVLGRIHEQWVYGNNQYIYFENGILSAWQD